jgi:hypothetical protein
MNHCIIGGVGDGDSGEDGGDEGRGRRGRRGGGAGDSPAAGIVGEHRPLAPFLHGFMGTLPHGGENVALVAANSWVEVSPMS